MIGLDAILLLLVALAAGYLAVDLLRGRRLRAAGSASAEPYSDPLLDADGEPRPGSLTHRLRVAGLPESILDFTLLLVVAGGLVLALTWLVLPLYAALILAVVAVFAVFAIVEQAAGRRMRRFEAQLADGIDLLIAALKGGENLPRALMSAGTACPHPMVRREFHEIADRLSVGAPIERAVARLSRRYDSEGTRLFTQTLTTKWRAGGEMAPVLEAVNRIIRDRIKLRMHLRSQLAGARLSALLGALIPYLIIPVYFWLKPDFFNILVSHPPGPLLLVVAIALQIVGILWLRRILEVKL